VAYATQKVRVISRITGYDDEPLTGSTAGLAVALTIYASDGTGDTIVADQAMSWDAIGNADGPYWYWDWPTGSNPPGRYKTEVHATGGPDDIDAFDFGTVTLKKRPSGTGA
jgi:nucleoside phosphorylase